MSYYSSRFTPGGVSYYSGFGSRSNASYRPRFQQGRTKPDYDSTWWKYRHYAQDDVKNTEDASQVIKVDYQLEPNRKAHRTSSYGISSLIVRRGQGFILNVETGIPFSKTKDRLEILLSKGEKPQESKGTLLGIDIYNDKAAAENNNQKGWMGYISAINAKGVGSVVSLIVQSPPDALVGKYSVKIKLFGADLNEKKKRFIKTEEDPIYVLFNAWCKDDQVYMDKEADREEYVLNETGRIFIGSTDRLRGRPWNFGQFSRYSLEGAVYLLEICKSINDQGHGNATQVTRALSQMANSCDDDKGVLTGNWSGSYTGGTSPTQWTGSQAIMEQYMLTKREVKYGQCWVFSGLLTTLGRALGIPTRSVTNFNSAHDSDNSMTIDKHFNITGEPIPEMDDSIWNFHVWNESCFKRPDLPDGYDGWQAYDATPQEASEYIYRCGPASVNAIKKGSVYLGYDTKFIFAEVNADIMTWLVFSSGSMFARTSQLNSSHVGKFISTKKVGSSDREDVTRLYKYAEGSPEEREVVAQVSKYSSRSQKLGNVYTETSSDVVFVYSGKMKENGDVDLSVVAQNTAKQVRTVTVTVTSTAAYYTGVSGEKLSTDRVEVQVQKGKSEEKSWSIKAKDYFNIIDHDATLKVYVMASVKETEQVFVETEMFEVDKPDLLLKPASSSPKVGEDFEVTITMTNPLDMSLTEGVIRLEGPGIQKSKKIPLHRAVPAKGELKEKVVLRAKYPGKREVIACFNSRQLHGIHGAVTVNVQ